MPSINGAQTANTDSEGANANGTGAQSLSANTVSGNGNGGSIRPDLKDDFVLVKTGRKAIS